MKKMRTISGAVMIIFFTGILGCGSKGNVVPGPAAPVISFSASGNPAANSVYLENVSTNGDQITLAIKVKAGSDVYGAAPTLTYDGSKIKFVSASASGSYLGTDLTFSSALLNGQEGALIIGIDRKGVVSGKNGDGLLLTIVLKALTTQKNTSIAFNTTNSLLYNSSSAPNNKISGTTWPGGDLSYQ